MLAKTIASLASISLMTLVSPALATDSTVEHLALRDWASWGNCPANVLVGIRGESFVSGVRFTVATKDLIAPGTRMEILGRDPAKLTWTAPLKDEISDCFGSTEKRVMWSNDYFQVRFQNGFLFVDMRNASPSLRLDLASTYNNQAIFEVSEIL